MKHIFYLIFFMCYSSATTAQQWTWAKTYTSTATDVQGNCIAIDPSNQIYLATPVDTSGSIILKTDSSGNELWRKFISGNIAIKDIEFYNNNLYVSGIFSNNFSFSGNTYTSAGVTDFFISSFDTNGNLLWLKTYGGNGYDVIQDMIVTNNKMFLIGTYSGTLIAGSFTASAIPSTFFFSRYDLTGNIDVFKSAASSYTYAGSCGYKMDFANGQISIAGRWIDQLILDTLQLTYYTNNSYPGNFLARTDLNGNFNKLEWLGNVLCDFTGLKLNSDSTYLLAGWNYWTSGYEGVVFCTKKNYSNGFSASISPPCYGDDARVSDATGVGNSYFILGQILYGGNCITPTVTSTLFLTKFSNSLTTIYEQDFASTGEIYACRIKQQGSFFIVSGILSSGGARFGQDSIYSSGPSVFIAKLTDTPPLPTELNTYKNQDEFFDIFPNPSSGEVTFKLKTPTHISSIVIKDQLGREVTTFTGTTDTFTVYGLVAGFYTVQIINGSASGCTKKLVIK